MNISHDGTSVRFKTEPKELFEAEKTGAKPNTVRILDIDEYHQLRKHNPKKIIIQHQQEIFLRTITNIHPTKGVFDKVIVVISWTNEEHHHPPAVDPHSVPVEPGDHNMAIENEPYYRVHRSRIDDAESFVTVVISNQMYKALQIFRHGCSIDFAVRELYEYYLNKYAEERGPIRD